MGFTQAQAVGQPAGTPVYFAVDQDAAEVPSKFGSEVSRQAVLDYLQGVQDGRAQYIADMKKQNKPVVDYAIGIYGGSCVLSWAQAQGIATFFWQAFAPAWCAGSNRNVWPGANIRTTQLDTPQRCKNNLDYLEGWGHEGGWMLGAHPNPELEYPEEHFRWP